MPDLALERACGGSSAASTRSGEAPRRTRRRRRGRPRSRPHARRLEARDRRFEGASTRRAGGDPRRAAPLRHHRDRRGERRRDRAVQHPARLAPRDAAGGPEARHHPRRGARRRQPAAAPAVPRHDRRRRRREEPVDRRRLDRGQGDARRADARSRAPLCRVRLGAQRRLPDARSQGGHPDPRPHPHHRRKFGFVRWFLGRSESTSPELPLNLLD